MPYVERDGVNVYYEAHGDGEAVLLTPGRFATSIMYRGQVEALKDHYRIVTWDTRGHGRSGGQEASDGRGLEATVDDMAAILDEEQIERAVIGGLSLGGYLSLAFHLKYPERIRALMLFDTNPGDSPVIHDLLERIQVPTLVLVGANDRPYLAAADYMAGKIANSTSVVIEGAGHAANIDQAEAFNDAVNAFLVAL